jgi:hypothetical protein
MFGFLCRLSKESEILLASVSASGFTSTPEEGPNALG